MRTSTTALFFAVFLPVTVVAGCAASFGAESDAGTDADIDGGPIDGGLPDASMNPRIPVSLLTFDQFDMPIPDGYELDDCNFESTNCIGELLLEYYPFEERCDFQQRRLFEFRCGAVECRSSITYLFPDALDGNGRIVLAGSTNCPQPAPPCEELRRTEEGTRVRGAVFAHFDRETIEEALDCELTIPP